MDISDENIFSKAQKRGDYFATKLKSKLVALKYPNLNSERIGALCAGVYDMYEGYSMVYKYYLPIIIDKKNFNKEKLADVLFDLHWELDHIKRHIEDIGDEIILISNFLDESNNKKDIKGNKISKREPRKWLKFPKIFRK